MILPDADLLLSRHPAESEFVVISNFASSLTDLNASITDFDPNIYLATVFNFL